MSKLTKTDEYYLNMTLTVQYLSTGSLRKISVKLFAKLSIRINQEEVIIMLNQNELKQKLINTGYFIDNEYLDKYLDLIYNHEVHSIN